MMPTLGGHLIKTLVVGLSLAASICSTALQAQPYEHHEPQHVGSKGEKKEHHLAKAGRLAYDMETVIAPATPRAPLLVCFQVAQPVLQPSGGAVTVTLMEHQFANSYGAPFVGNFTPPDVEFDHVVINFTVEVRGRQFDRWGTVYLGNVNIFSTSTAEPTRKGITWTWRKNVTPYLSLWKQPQTVIFQLDNVVNVNYTGLLNSTLTATFFKSNAQGGSPPADLILPVSAGKSPVTGSYWTYPEENAVAALTFPRNVNRAVFSANVKPHANDEFWWSNVPQSAVDAFRPDVEDSLPGFSPFREVQVLIDGMVAGVYWPFPIIFTGGVVPQLHSPIVGIDAFDLRDHEIDISPWLPLLCDGKEHTFAIKVVGLVDDGKTATLSNTTESSWFLVGKVFLWLDSEGSVTTGTLGTVTTEPIIDFEQKLTRNATGFNQTLDYKISVKRTFGITSKLRTQKGSGTATWSQSLEYSNVGGLYSNGYDGINTFLTTGKEKASVIGSDYETSFSYPLFCNSTVQYLPGGNLTLWAQLDQGLKLEVRGDGVFPNGAEAFAGTWDGSLLDTERNGTGNYSRAREGKLTTGVGSTRQIFRFSGLKASTEKELYTRDVSAFNNSVTADREVVGRLAL